MIPWYWLLIVASAFTTIGYILCALFAKNGRDER